MCMRKPCVITIDPDGEIAGKAAVDIETGGISYFEIINYLKGVQTHFAQEILKEAEKHVGKDPKKQEKWMDEMMEKYVR